jgi:pilus assembly protein CpaD
MKTKFLFRGFSLGALLIAGSCAQAPDTTHLSLDGLANHPIAVEPSYQSMKLYFSPADAGIQPAEQAKFTSFVANYEAHGNGAIAVNAPSGVNSQAALGFFAQRINEMGVSKDRILVATHDAPDGDMRVEINYVTYQARADRCADWSEDLAVTLSNETPRNFGCSIQRNIAAQIADPRDLMTPHELAASDGARRTTVITNYETGKVTAADKSPDQSASTKSGQ